MDWRVGRWLAGWLAGKMGKSGWRKAGKNNQLANEPRGMLGDRGPNPSP